MWTTAVNINKQKRTADRGGHQALGDFVQVTNTNRKNGVIMCHKGSRNLQDYLARQLERVDWIQQAQSRPRSQIL